MQPLVIAAVELMSGDVLNKLLAGALAQQIQMQQRRLP